MGSYYYCPSDKIKIDGEFKKALICSEITGLISRYGEWGSVVTDSEGAVLLNAEYAYCAKKMGYGVLVYAICTEDVEDFLQYISLEYGKYNFDNLGIKTYHQFKAQLHRRNSNDNKNVKTSKLYEKYLIPNLQKTDHIIDIGAGRMAYMKLVKSMGYDIHAYELFFARPFSIKLQNIFVGFCNYILQFFAKAPFSWSHCEHQTV